MDNFVITQYSIATIAVPVTPSMKTSNYPAESTVFATSYVADTQSVSIRSTDYSESTTFSTSNDSHFTSMLISTETSSSQTKISSDSGSTSLLFSSPANSSFIEIQSRDGRSTGLNSSEVVNSSDFTPNQSSVIPPVISEVIVNRSEGNQRKLKKRFISRNMHPDDRYRLSVQIKLERSVDSNSEEFREALKAGLTHAYKEGRNKQLGISVSNADSYEKTRSKRDVQKKKLAIRRNVTNVDNENSDHVEVRFSINDFDLSDKQDSVRIFDSAYAHSSTILTNEIISVIT